MLNNVFKTKIKSLLPFLSVITVSLFIILLITALLLLNNLHTLQVNSHANSATQPGSPTPQPIPLPKVDSALAQQVVQIVPEYLDFLKGSPSQDFAHITDYKIDSVQSAYTNNNDIHSILIISLKSADSTSKNLLLSTGGVLKDGWVTKKNLYTILVKQQNGNYTIKSVSFQPFPGF